MTNDPTQPAPLLLALIVALLCGAALLGAEKRKPPAPAPAPPPAELNPPPVPDSPPTARPLSETREIDQTYGLSLRLPVETTVLKQTGSPYLMQVVDSEKKFQIYVSVRRMLKAMSLNDFSDLAQKQLAGRFNSAHLLGPVRDAQLAERPAKVLYVLIPPYRPADTSRMVLGQAYLPVAADTFAIVEIDSPAIRTGQDKDQQDLYDQDPGVRATFEAVLQTLEIKSPRNVEAERKAAVALTGDLQRAMTPDKLHAAIIDRQILRIVESRGGKSKDVGWMEVRQKLDQRLDKTGVGVKVQYRVILDSTIYDTLADYFTADDDSFEEWTVTTTQRPPGSPTTDDPKVNEHTFIETGVRTGPKIEVRLDSPKGARNLPLPRPDFAYLSQAHHWLLPQLLPPDRPATYGSYYCSIPHEKVVFRTDQVVPTLDGFTLLTRISPNDSLLKASYTADRRIKVKNLSDTRRLVRTTEEELKKIWPNG